VHSSHDCSAAPRSRTVQRHYLASIDGAPVALASMDELTLASIGFQLLHTLSQFSAMHVELLLGGEQYCCEDWQVALRSAAVAPFHYRRTRTLPAHTVNPRCTPTNRPTGP
jgi:hypothetical protein